ncbi:MAG: hypothetical protein ACJ74T_08380 [Pyrinomonadaceae bacterium]
MSKENLAARVAPSETYPHWEIKSPPFPARSRLFRIEPVWVGTPKVESLTSYVARLSEAHSVTSRMLLRREIYPAAGRSVSYFSGNLGFSSRQINGIDKIAEATAVGLEKLTCRGNLHNRVLCHLCARLNLSPVDLLCEKNDEVWLENYVTAHSKDEPKRKLPVAWEEIEDKLQVALGEFPPPSLEAIARQLGYYPARLKGNCPEVCGQIISRYRSYIRSTHPTSRLVIKTLRSAMKEEPPPSLQSVFRRLGCKDTGYYYYSNYFDLCTAIAQRYKNFRNKPFDKKVTEKQLKSALTENPPPSFSSVAKRLGHKRDFFRQKYPEIARAIASRHMQHRRAQQRERATQLREMIRAAIKSILAFGKYVSEARVKEYLRQHRFSSGRDSLFKQALHEMKSEMGI